MFGGEEAPGLAQAGGDLVEDQQRAVGIAGLAYRLPIARRRDGGHRARRLGDHRRHIAFAFEHVLDHRRASQPALREKRLAVFIDRVAVGAAVTGKGRDMLGAGQQRPDGAAVAEQRFATDARCAETRAVEGVPEAQGLEAPGGGARQFDRDLHRIAAAGGEQDAPGLAGQALELRRQSFGQFDCALTGKAPRRKREFVELGLDGCDDMRMRIADVVHVVAVEVHVAPAGHVFDIEAFGAADRRQAGR